MIIRLLHLLRLLGLLIENLVLEVGIGEKTLFLRVSRLHIDA